MHSLLDSIPDETKQKEQFILSFDGKLIRSGLSGEHGDVDMAGIEESPTLEESKNRLEMELDLIQNIQADLLVFDSDHQVAELSPENMNEVLTALQRVVKILTLRLKEMREMKRAREYNIKCMIESAGGEENWRNGKLVNAISKAKLEVAQMEQFIKESLKITKKVCLVARASMNQGKP